MGVTSYRPINLTSVVRKQMEHVVAGYLRQVWDTSKWLYEGQHGCRPRYSCESQIVTVCQDIADYLDKGARIGAIIILSKTLHLVAYGRLLMKIATSGVDFDVYLSLQKERTVFFYILCKSVFSTVRCTVPVFSVSISHGTF